MDLSLLGIFAAGTLTFFTPCVLPLIPMYISALVGTSVLGIKEVNRGQMLLKSAAFSAGLVAVFTVLGFGASAVGSFFREHRVMVLLLAAIIIMAFGLKFLNILKLPFVDRVLRADASRAAGKAGVFGAFFMGVIFAAGWSPCAGPVLGSVLTYTASKTTDVLTGGLYLATYGLGLALPLLVTAALAETGIGYIQRANRLVPVFEKAIGVLLVVLASTLLFQVGSLTPDKDTSYQTVAAAKEAQPEKVALLPVMMEFYSEDCEICEEMEPLIAELNRECGRSVVDVRKVDIFGEEGGDLARKFGIFGVPTFVFLDGGGLEKTRLVGYQTKRDLMRSIADVSGGKTCS
jgi:cytochrome c-type biogenesis protein